MNAITTIDDPRYVKAMSHPLRVRILAMLDERTASPVELASWLGASLGTVAYHVRTLERFGLIELVGETRVRGAVEHHYRARERPRVSDEAWAKAPAIAKQAAIGSSLQLIDEYVRASAAAGGFDHASAHLSRTALRLDGQGFQELAQTLLELLERVERIEDGAAERIKHNPHADDITDVALVAMAFEAARLTNRVDGEARAPHRRHEPVGHAD
jgi:DNA-binding transcriptional ArsR family regulator